VWWDGYSWMMREEGNTHTQPHPSSVELFCFG